MNKLGKIAIFGTGSVAEECFTELERLGAQTVVAVDNNSSRQGAPFHGLSVISPKQLAECDVDHIVIASSYHEEIQDQLSSMGIGRDVIIVYPGYSHESGIYTRFPELLSDHVFDLLVLPVTHKCGLECTHCPKDKKVYYPEWEIPLEEYTTFLKQFDSSRFRTLNVSGSGDPFILKNFLDYLHVIRDQGWTNVSSFSSAAITKPDILEEIISQKLLNKITISLEAGSPERYRSIRGYNFAHLERFLQTVNDLRDKYASSLELVFSFTYGMMNLEEFHHVLELANRFRVGEVCASALVATYSNERAPEGKICIVDNVVKDFSDSKVQQAIQQGRELATKYGIDLKLRQGLEKHACFEPYEMVRVDKLGDVYPCCAGSTMPHPVGNLKKENFQAIWEGEHYAKILHDMAYAAPEDNAYCRDCWYFQGDYAANTDLYYDYPYDL